MYDAIVIGARCAGASTAMLLAREGYKVLLVDRASFPSDVPQGHLIHRHGPRRLHRWGLLEPILATGCPAITAMTLDAGDFPLTGRNLAVDGAPLAVGPRRSALDALLVDAAVAAGAEVRQEFVVEGIVRDADGSAVAGIRGRQRGSRTSVTERATVTIGADGRHSDVAKWVQAPAYETVPTLTCWYFSYWSDVPGDALEVHVRGRRVIFAFPTNDNLFAIFIAWPRDEMHEIRKDIEGAFMAVIDMVPDLAERMQDGRRAEPFRGASDLPNYLRQPSGPGWALVGDAGVHKDPYLALGVCDALRDAEFLVEALTDGFAGRAAFADALAGYERRRNEATLPDYQRNLHAARFEPLTAEQAHVRAMVRGDQEATNQYIMAIEGLIAPELFFNPRNLARLMADKDGGRQAMQSPAASLGAIVAP